jgi:GAF domain-containing protein
VTPAEVAAAVVTHGMRDLGARQGMLALPTPDGAALELVGPRGVPPEVARAWRSFPVDAPVPLAEAYRLRLPVLVETVAEYDARYPSLANTTRALGNQACAALPLEVDGRVLGSLAFTFSAERAFTAADRAFLETVARQCAQALERARLYEAEQRARAEAEGANRAKSDFLATMSHELRTPLNAIAGYVELLEMGIHGPVSDRQLDALHRIRRNQRHLLGLINDVLNFARLETGRLSLRVEPVDVGQALAGLEPLVAPQLSARALRYDCRLPPAPLAVRADPERGGRGGRRGNGGDPGARHRRGDSPREAGGGVRALRAAGPRAHAHQRGNRAGPCHQPRPGARHGGRPARGGQPRRRLRLHPHAPARVDSQGPGSHTDRQSLRRTVRRLCRRRVKPTVFLPDTKGY